VLLLILGVMPQSLMAMCVVAVNRL